MWFLGDADGKSTDLLEGGFPLEDNLKHHELSVLENGVASRKKCVDSDYDDRDEDEEEDDVLDAAGDREDSLGEMNALQVLFKGQSKLEWASVN